MGDGETATLDREAQLRSYRVDELRRLGFTMKQRTALLERIETGELQLGQVQHIIDDLHATAEQAWWCIS